jgi:hypothetical protein
MLDLKYHLNLQPLKEGVMLASMVSLRQRIARIAIALVLLAAFGCSTSGQEAVDATSTANAAASQDAATA